jgi:hypothetical protein
MDTRRITTATVALLALIATAGCRVHSDRGDKDVDIRTPLGSISVHKGKNDPKATGLSVYPGAQIKEDYDDDRHSSATVDISSSFFGLKVVALKYQSNDSPDKIRSFYQKDMSKYGNVIDCTGGFSLSFHRHDQDSDVTCDDHDVGDRRYREELKVGTEHNQRIVAIRPSGNGAEFALVYVKAWDEKTTM